MCSTSSWFESMCILPAHTLYPSLLAYLFSVLDPSISHTLMVSQHHAGRSTAYAPTSRMSDDRTSSPSMVHHTTPPNTLASPPHASPLASAARTVEAHSLLVLAPVHRPHVDQPPRDSFQIQANLLIPPWILSASSTPPLWLMIFREFYQRFKPA